MDIVEEMPAACVEGICRHSYCYGLHEDKLTNYEK